MPETEEAIWCLLCEQRPADGILYRVTPDAKKVPLAEDQRTPHVCLDCGRKQNRTKGHPFHGLSTLWRFTPYAQPRKAPRSAREPR